ncbi:hypothetical protein H312_00762 [Anncaliia algerae PRA339]|uniref:Sm domain-containing protein n=1 Tax=Anncaliia algerae PRA339 TaxID=1288291 RepID=A0A059F3J7_9MICR|nr:hypothetical protein H312_00762 [Anncaliia algerae PRA339]
MSESIPFKLLYESLNLKISLDMKNGSSITGILIELDDLMNIQLKNAIILTNSTSKLVKSIYLRGSEINFFVLPPAMKFTPILLKERNKN